MLIVLLSSMAVVGASQSMVNTAESGASSGYSTYIVAFKGDPSIQAESRLAGLLDSFNGRIVYHYSIIDGVAVTMPDDRVDELKALSDVKYVEKDQQVHILLDRAVPQIGADKVWASGYTGKGVKVCVIDTGVDASHPDLNGNKVVAWVDYVNGKSTPYDDHGHGTHVSSTIAGTGNASGGQYRGVAPEASLMEAKVLSSQGSGSNTNILKAIDWAVNNGAQVISMSLGSNSHSQAMDDAIKNAVNRGVVVVVAAGNSGPNARTIACPGDSPDAITVGAVDRNDAIASFSSRGPTYDGRIKPDVTNVGVGLMAAKAAGTNAGKGTQYYVAMSGTSMATPMTSGVVALLLQANGSLTPAQVKDVLTKTAKPLGGSVPNNNYGYGRVDAKAALDYVLTGKVPAPTPTPTPGPSPTPTPQPGAGYSVTLTNMFAKYNGQYGQMERFQVKAGTTIAQGIMLANTGSAADSYTVTVNGIPGSWWTMSGYDGGTLQPKGGAAYLTLQVTPGADAASGSYRFNVTATSKTDSSVMSTKSYTLNVVSSISNPVPGKSFAGAVSRGQEYYAYLAPDSAGQITATISWQSFSNDLNGYLYDPSGKLVARAENRHTTSETVQYSAPAGGYYLLKVTANAYSPVSFTGSTNVNVQPAYVKAGTIQPGRPVTLSISADGKKPINARVAWTWPYNTIALSLLDSSGQKVAQGTRVSDGFNSAYEQIDYKATAGTYTLKLESDSSSQLSYKLVTPFQL
ncbi:Subtilisin-like serine proteases (peptidase S8 family) [Methanocella conradii HZ254]|uniref:Subtilisin-like serine proteases (Peptidase S8 family) n=1 Tax=Methanocella conradii (strain DSM 24694 / JCM 17849 / CGMCC 1.5162 / HZ254) TaxID=1041930 RepID=H8I699_METCZ|nr:S8 family serine peptidase [Methanocella conradii]AFD00746.1 Subtilisin-like serine proteases (peptidase S8 family) [Methanocella conradii HZ254]